MDDDPALLCPGPWHQGSMSAMVLPGHQNPGSYGAERAKRKKSASSIGGTPAAPPPQELSGTKWSLSTKVREC